MIFNKKLVSFIVAVMMVFATIISALAYNPELVGAEVDKNIIMSFTTQQLDSFMTPYVEENPYYWTRNSLKATIWVNSIEKTGNKYFIINHKIEPEISKDIIIQCLITERLSVEECEQLLILRTEPFNYNEHIIDPMFYQYIERLNDEKNRILNYQIKENNNIEELFEPGNLILE